MMCEQTLGWGQEIQMHTQIWNVSCRMEICSRPYQLLQDTNRFVMRQYDWLAS